MTSLLSHRGPDDQGSLHEPGVAFGHRRLSIIDREGGHQPIANEDASRFIIFNGEIYNHLEIRSRLRGRGTATGRPATRKPFFTWWRRTVLMA